MNEDVLKDQPIVRYENGELVNTQDSYVTEFPLTIMVNGEEFATVICSPNNMEELTLGFLASEGAILKI
jgi:FdhD protein